MQILLACARTQLSGRGAETLSSLLRRPVEWEELRRLARWHRLSGLLFYHLRRPPHAALVPRDLLDALRNAYLVTAARHLRSRRELARILAVLKAEDIPVVLLKGAALVGTVYDEPGLRPMGDFDLLVPRSRLRHAQDVVQRQGYDPAEDGREEHWALHQHLPKLIGAAGQVSIEVHGHVVRLDGPLAFDIEEFWSRARPAPDAAGGLVLAPEDMVLHLCLNFFRDRRFYSRGAIGQLCDLSEALRHHPSLDWGAIVERSVRYGVAGPVACALRLAQLLLDAQIPDRVVPELAPAMLDSDVAAFARLRVATTRSWVTTELVKPEEPYGRLSLLRSILRRIVPTREYMRLHYGDAGVDTYWRRFGHAAQLLAKFVQRPSELTDDLGVDRWVHALQESGRTKARRRGGPRESRVEEAVR
jgi:hypothetical protein